MPDETLIAEVLNAAERVAVIMPIHGCLNYTKQTMRSLKSPIPVTWIVIDNHPDGLGRKYFEGTEVSEMLNAGDSFFYYPQTENIGVARSWNLGLAIAQEKGIELFFVINNDIVFAEDTFRNLLRWFSGQQLLSVVNIGPDSKALKTHTRLARAIPFPEFIGFLTDAKTIERVGLFDEQFLVGYFEDDDYKMRLKEAGIPALACLDAPVSHYGSRAIHEGGVQHEPEFTNNRERFRKKWGYVPGTVRVLAERTRKKLLWIGDAGCQTGFARVTQNVLDRLKDRWDIHVLAVNYHGDPHNLTYPLYPANTGGDVWGLRRYAQMCKVLKPDVVCVLNDVFWVTDFVELNKEVKANLCAYIPVDSVNVKKEWAEPISDLSLAIFYTKFGLEQLREGGFSGPSVIIPHGVDTSIYYPTDKHQARVRLGLNAYQDWFIIGNVNMNQPRKRQDLTIRMFARFLDTIQKNGKQAKVALYLHYKTQGNGWDCLQLAEYYGINHNFIFLGNDNKTMVAEDKMRFVYSALDLQVSTTMGEGWGLCHAEGMACGIAQLVPGFAALGEWAKDVTAQVPCPTVYHTPGNINMGGGLIDEDKFSEKLLHLYRNNEYRNMMAERGLKHVRQPCYSWDVIADTFDSEFLKVCNKRRDGANVQIQS